MKNLSVNDGLYRKVTFTPDGSYALQRELALSDLNFDDFLNTVGASLRITGATTSQKVLSGMFAAAIAAYAANEAYSHLSDDYKQPIAKAVSTITQPIQETANDMEKLAKSPAGKSAINGVSKVLRYVPTKVKAAGSAGISVLASMCTDDDDDNSLIAKGMEEIDKNNDRTTENVDSSVPKYQLANNKLYELVDETYEHTDGLVGPTYAADGTAVPLEGYEQLTDEFLTSVHTLTDLINILDSGVVDCTKLDMYGAHHGIYVNELMGNNELNDNIVQNSDKPEMHIGIYKYENPITHKIRYGEAIILNKKALDMISVNDEICYIEMSISNQFDVVNSKDFMTPDDVKHVEYNLGKFIEVTDGVYITTLVCDDVTTFGANYVGLADDNNEHVVHSELYRGIPVYDSNGNFIETVNDLPKDFKKIQPDNPNIALQDFLIKAMFPELADEN